MPQAAYVRCNFTTTTREPRRGGLNAASGICSLKRSHRLLLQPRRQVSMPQAAYVRCNITLIIFIFQNLVSMPQAAYVRCNCTHVNPPWILNKNKFHHPHSITHFLICKTAAFIQLPESRRLFFVLIFHKYSPVKKPQIVPNPA